MTDIKREAYSGEVYHNGRWHSLHCLQVYEVKEETKMMDISNLTDQEKSVVLAKVLGWGIEEQYSEDIQKSSAYWTSWMSDDKGTPIEFPCGESTIQWTSPAFKPSFREFELNLYKPKNMALAWRCHLWCMFDSLPAVQVEYRLWWVRCCPWYAIHPPRLWLDKILELAIEARIVAEEERG